MSRHIVFCDRYSVLTMPVLVICWANLTILGARQAFFLGRVATLLDHSYQETCAYRGDSSNAGIKRRLQPNPRPVSETALQFCNT